VNVETLVPENGQLALPRSYREAVEEANGSPLHILDIDEKK
jgi:bifunctional DNA-binding transcriptional regulator/antitoxin component of YhaV-PrlF toxin-antitoxin module